MKRIVLALVVFSFLIIPSLSTQASAATQGTCSVGMFVVDRSATAGHNIFIATELNFYPSRDRLVKITFNGNEVWETSPSRRLVDAPLRLDEGSGNHHAYGWGIPTGLRWTNPLTWSQNSRWRLYYTC